MWIPPFHDTEYLKSVYLRVRFNKIIITASSGTFKNVTAIFINCECVHVDEKYNDY